MHDRTPGAASARREFKNAGDPPTGSEAATAVARVMSAFEEFKTTNDIRLQAIERKGAADPLLTEKLARLDAVLAADEGRNQAVTAATAQAKAAVDQAAELKTQLDALEIKLGRPGAAPGVDPRVELKARVGTWARAVFGAYSLGVPNLSAEEQKAIADVAAEYKTLNISADDGGGYLAPTAFVAEIIKSVTETSPVRSLVRVRTTANRSLSMPRRTSQFAARRAGELDKRDETKGLAYGLIEVDAPEMFAIVDISNAMLEDAAFDMQAEISGEAVEQFAVREGAEVFTGTGVGQCEGILVNKDVKSSKSGSAASVADADGGADGILKLYYALKTAYGRNAVWALNRTTLGSVRVLKDAQGRYLWTPGIADKQANTINGAPYVECPDMPNEGAGNSPIAFGDFMKGYTLVDRIAMSMLRDPFSEADNGAVRFRFRKRMGGRVTLSEAMVKLTCGA